MSDKSGEVGIRLDCVDDSITPDWTEVIRRIDSIVSQFGYKVRQYGPWPEMKRAAVEEAEFIGAIMRHTSDMPNNVPGENWVVLGGNE